MELAKVEMTAKGKRLGAGAGMFGGAGFFGWFGFGALTTAAILALATAVDGWLAALIVAAVYFAVAGVLALVGKNKVADGSPPVPEQAIETTKQDIDTIKARAKGGQ
jgi:membrane protein implicated in regulation of membrane protease activity